MLRPSSARVGGRRLTHVQTAPNAAPFPPLKNPGGLGQKRSDQESGISTSRISSSYIIVHTFQK
eukprot:6039657-Pyramimonas_sp.AAC.1